MHVSDAVSTSTELCTQSSLVSESPETPVESCNLHYEKFADGSVKCIEDEIPFDLPDGWAWTRISSIIQLFSGQDLTPDRYNDAGYGIPYITGASNLDDGKVIINRWTTSPTTHSTTGDLLLTVKGSGVGKMAYSDIADAHIARQIMALRCESEVENKYLGIVVSALISDIVSKANGLIPGISRDVILYTLCPLPPKNEQCFIVESVNDICGIVDALESSSADLENNIIIAKSKILDLAIRGQLVPQNPADELASVLLDRIRAEKEELIEQGKIKRDKKESVIFKGEDNSYYEDIPQNWEEVSLLSIAEVELGKTLDSARNTGEPRDYLRSVNIRWNEIDLSDLKQMKIESEELERYTVHKGDLLICEGGDVGRCCIWERDTPIIYQNALHRVRFFGSCSPKFFLYYMMYLESLGYLKRVSNGVTIKHLTKNVLASIPFLLPPVAEQYRIVTAIEESFSYLDSVANTLE